MATTFALNIVCQDADLPDLLAAMKLRYATNAVPNPTQAQLRAALEADVRQQLVTAVLQYRRDNDGVAAPALG